jgi:hypothetical protein
MSSQKDDDNGAAPGDEEFPYSPNTASCIVHRMNAGDDLGQVSRRVFDTELETFRPYFSMPGQVDATAAALLDVFLPETLLDKWVMATTAYSDSRLTVSRRMKVQKQHILRFIAIIYYTGIVHLPSKEDYFPEPEACFWPSHPSVKLII